MWWGRGRGGLSKAGAGGAFSVFLECTNTSISKAVDGIRLRESDFFSPFAMIPN